jgi:DNA invertase Pin-like site-specific DNA recombinase
MLTEGGKMNKIRVVSYLRVSSTMQVEGDGFDRQRAAIAEYIKKHKLLLVDEYREEGISGTAVLAERPALAALMAGIASNGVRVVLVERADRLTRDMLAGEIILAKFRSVGVQVFDSSGNDLTVADGDPSRIFVRQLLAAVAQYDKALIVGRMRAGKDRIAERDGHRCEGQKPYGYYPGEQSAVARAQALLDSYVAGKRPHYAAVARELNAEGMLTRTGVPWSAAMVRRVLTR